MFEKLGHGAPLLIIISNTRKENFISLIRPNALPSVKSPDWTHAPQAAENTPQKTSARFAGNFPLSAHTHSMSIPQGLQRIGNMRSRQSSAPKKLFLYPDGVYFRC
jgi:hypothetical protein